MAYAASRMRRPASGPQLHSPDGLSSPAGGFALTTTAFSLRSHAPIPGIVTDAWLHFSGVELLVVEEVWNDSDTRGTGLDGEILNRVALYGVVDLPATHFQAVIAEVARYHPRVIMLPPRRRTDGPSPLPLYSMARRFVDLQQARGWLEHEPILHEGTIRQRLDDGLGRLAADKNR
jgi:hypothetical protein